MTPPEQRCEYVMGEGSTHWYCGQSVEFGDLGPREERTRVCAACGAVEKDTKPCAGLNYRDAHYIAGPVPDYCGPFEPESLDLHHVDRSLDARHKAVTR